MRAPDPVRKPEPDPAAVPPPTAFEHLPIGERPRMYPGYGVRHDCVHEAECLGRALQVERRERRRDDYFTSVHCPTGCRFLTPPSRDERIVEATAQRGVQGFGA